jgi:anti-anti-sigma regulatory factor
MVTPTVDLVGALDALAVGVCVWQLTEPGERSSLILRVCNPAAARFLGVEIEAVLDKPIAVGFPGSLETPLPGVFTKVIETGEMMSLGDVPYSDDIVPDGIFSIFVRPIGDRCALVEFTNVTHERRAQNETATMLAAAEAARGEAERMAATTKALDEKLRIIEAQKREIQVLTAPILELWAGVLALPLSGRFDRERSAIVREKLLAAVCSKRASTVIIDVTGLESTDEVIAEELLRLARSLGLLGAKAYFSGISPSNALIMANLDQEIPLGTCLRSLQHALALVMPDISRATPP